MSEESVGITAKSDNFAPKVEAEDNDSLIIEVRERYRQGVDGNKKNVGDAHDDLLHVSGEEQWDPKLRKEREDEGRPCLTVNKLPSFIAQVVGDQRQNRPQIKVHPVDEGADQQTAEIFSGLIRNIESISDASIAYDHGFECAVNSGWGWIRVVTEYSDDDAFDQDIKIKRVPNPFSVVWDPCSTNYDLSDAGWMFISETISKDEFKSRFPKVPANDFDSSSEFYPYWSESDDSVRIAEYFRKIPKQKTLYLLENGQVVDEIIEDPLLPPPVVVKTRTVNSYEIEWYLVSGSNVLDGPKIWPGKYYPLIPVWGKELWVNGKRWLQSLIRHAKDAQRLYNYDRTTYAEVVALQPRSPYLVTPQQIENHEGQWNSFHVKNWPYMLYNPDPMNPGRPQRELPPQVSQGLLQAINISDVELKSTTGMFDPSLGDRVGQQSGKAILSLQRKGDIGTFVFADNLGRAIGHLGKVLIDLIPKIYDTERIIRIIGFDESIKSVPINQQIPGSDIVLNDITVGKYDVVVSFGPSFATQRLEAASAMIQFVTQGMPQEMVVGVADIIADNLDWPGKEKFIKRIKKLQPPGLHEEEGQPGQPPNPIQQAQAQQQAMQQQQMQMAMQQQALMLQKLQLDMDKTKQDMEAKQAEIMKKFQEAHGVALDNEEKKLAIIDRALPQETWLIR